MNFRTLPTSFLFWLLSKIILVCSTEFLNIIKLLYFRFSGIDSLFKKINCDQAAIVDMLGGNAGVTDSNMMQVNIPLLCE